MLSIIIPAYNEETVLAQCLDSLLLQSYCGPLEIIVATNGCKDKTLTIAIRFASAMEQKKYHYTVLDIDRGNKANALNVADQAAIYGNRMYLDADVVCEPELVTQVVSMLNKESPQYVSGTLDILNGASFFSRAYGRIWKETPYIRDTVPGCGCYAVNRSGRELWDNFPPIHSDDKFVRLLFSSAQRTQVKAKYYWPLPQGFITLVNIRTRWIRGNRQLSANYPELSVNDSKRINLDASFIKKIFRYPISTCVFLAIYSISAMRAYIGSVNQSIVWSRAR